MKMSNLTIVFLIIAVVILIVLTKYISLQIETINRQNEYNSKLIDSTKQAIDAFEINTVHWNSNFYNVNDSKRRSIMASINTFTSSFANNTGIGRTSKEFILSYMPAIAYTLYDGFYIYTPSETKKALLNSNGVREIMSDKLFHSTYENDAGTMVNVIEDYAWNEENNGKVLYEVAARKTKDGTYFGTPFTLDSNKAAISEGNKHILKPFASYSEKLISGSNIGVINYTLDNYVSVHINDGTDFVSKSGYLVDTSKITMPYNTISGIKYNNKEIKGEKLKENINYIDISGKSVIGSFYYVYDAENKQKIYIDSSDNAFYLEELKVVKVGAGSKHHKRCTVPTTTTTTGYIELFQNLETGEWYSDINETTKMDGGVVSGYGISLEKKMDYSAVNYCVESYGFTNWFNSKNFNVYKIENGNYSDNETDDEVLIINSNNNPDPESENSENSAFSMHKKEVIKYVLNSSLNQAITSYSNKHSGEYKLPKLTETDWDKVLKNVCIIAFVQNMPIGLKYYNNYAIATSNLNREYVDPNEIYLYSQDDPTHHEYHRAFCKKIDESDTSLIGYRSIDFVEKTYLDSTDNINKNYFKHEKNVSGTKININQECYYCLVQRSQYNPAKTENKETAYYTALARERYISRK